VPYPVPAGSHKVWIGQTSHVLKEPNCGKHTIMVHIYNHVQIQHDPHIMIYGVLLFTKNKEKTFIQLSS
jgi:hypothetical protein